MLDVLLGLLIIFGPIIVYNLPFIILTVIGFSRMKKGKKHYYYYFIAAICVTIIINVLFLSTPYSAKYADVAFDYSFPLVLSSVVAIVIALLILKVKRTSVFPQQLNVGNKWLDFYTNIRYPLSIIVGLFRIGADLINANQQGLFGDSVFWLSFIIELSLFIFFWVAMNELSRRTRRGYNLNNLLLCIEGFYVPWVSSFSSYEKDLAMALSVWLGVVLVYYVCWVTPNLIYFKHRQYLFFDDSGTKGTDFVYDEEYERNHIIAADLVDQAKRNFEKKSAQPGFMKDFEKRMLAAAERRNILYQNQKPEKADYGYDPGNPVMASTIESSKEYLARLRTDDGRKFTWNRRGSHAMLMECVQDVVMVDEYELYLDGLLYKTIFICPYGHDTDMAPQGLSLLFVDKNVTNEGDQAFCKMCGASVNKTARYCRSCGAELKKQSDHDSRSLDSGGIIRCKECGAPLLKGMTYCNNCGCKIEWKNETLVTDNKSYVPVSTDKPGSSVFSNLSPTLRRAYYFIEDAEWGRAADYLEQVLDSDPENPYANLGVAMIKVGVDSPFNLTDEEIRNLKKEKSYTRAKKYADGQLAELFDYWESK